MTVSRISHGDGVEQPARLTHRSAAGAWIMHTRPPAPALRRWVLSYHDYSEQVRYSVPRIERAAALVPVIINLGPKFRIGGRLFDSFTAGLDDGPVLSESTGASRCIQINLSPLGACRLFGMPLGTIAGRVIELRDILGPRGDELAERLELSTPAARFALLDRVLRQRIEASAPVPPALHWAWDELESSGGRRAIGSLTGELGWSRKRMITSFNDHLGFPPKVMARLIRFGRVEAAVRREPAINWSRLAVQCGYFDQAHLIHDCRQFTGVTPEIWRAQL